MFEFPAYAMHRQPTRTFFPMNVAFQQTNKLKHTAAF